MSGFIPIQETHRPMTPSIPHIPLNPSSIFYSILLCLCLVAIIRILYYTLNANNPYTITPGLEHHYQDHDDDDDDDELPSDHSTNHPGRISSRHSEMTSRTRTSFVGFSTITSPGGALCLPNLRFGSGHSDTTEPLLMPFDDNNEPLVELDAVSRDRRQSEDRRIGVSVHGTNTLNTTWGWMV
ncbi:hypothetical protein QQS21_001347 [Conoideocrella luteorostrata]|uniref:Uncharacterized protein n=1 Tax=Conoideocrella luteorostrata TaxID=1105319 RepID=A0AAJ0CX23_9HYPO|nr:hypothetical protein QQS21_001347 [Conoideocrella luteorostrata]